MKPKRRIISFLLAICLVVGLMPTAAFAAGTDTGKAIQLGTSGISDPTSAQNNSGRYYTPSDYVYFGVKGSDPIKWRVLDADKTNDGTTSGMFLLSEYLLDRGVVFERAWNSNDNDGQSNPNEWQYSDAQNWCSTFATNTDVFSTAEQAAFLGVTKTDNSEGSLYSSGWGTSSLTENDKVFFLSVRELADYVGNYDGAPGLRATDTAQSAGPWWLRSPYASYTIIAGLVFYDGLVDRSNVGLDWAARPAFNLNLNSVLFTSAAVGGKTDSTVDGNLTSVADYTGNEWKLTLLDETREFAVTEQTVSGKPGDTITLNYTGATTGENEYISVIIADENGAQYYGRVAQPGGESGTATLSIPADLAPGSYTLNVFSEQYNGDYKTDYASAFAEVALTVEEAAAPGIDTGKAIQLVDSGTAANIGGGQADNIYFGTYQQSSDGSVDYNTDPIKWRVLENADGQLFLLSDQNLDVFQYHVDYESVTWATSTMRSWLNGYGASHNTGDSGGIDYTDDNFINTAFSEKEQKAIADTTVVNDDNPTYGTEGGENTNDKIFLLSIAEAQNSSYFADDNSRIATNTAYAKEQGAHTYSSTGAGDWWLRSPGYGDIDAALVDGDGCLYRLGFSVGNIDVCVRPAFNLNLNSVLFTSAAEGGKSASSMDSGLTAVNDYTGNEWKLTLLDSSRNFSISDAKIEESKIDFSYSNAQTGTNEYISVVIEDNGAITHYGRILQLDGTANGASGTASLTLPADVTLGGNTKLYVFNEQYNGDKMTDYASAFAEVALTVEEAAAPGIDTGKAIQLVDSGTAANIGGGQADNIYFGTYQQSSAGSTEPDGTEGVDWIKSDTANKNGQDPYYYIDPVKWRVLSNASGQLFLLSDQNLDVFEYHKDYESVTWETSTMRSWLNGYGTSENAGGDSGIDYTSDNFIGTAFSEKEQEAIANTEVVNDDNPEDYTEGGNNTTDKIFLLSIAEANNSGYFADNSSRIATNTAYVAAYVITGSSIGMEDAGEADYWWLRSPGKYDHRAAYVDSLGVVHSDGSFVSYDAFAVRPAFNLDLTSVLFTSAAVGGKFSEAVGADALQPVSEYAGNEWKLTLLDGNRSFTASTSSATTQVQGYSNWKVDVEYSSAQTGSNEYVSAMIVDGSGSVLYYGRVAQNRVSGTANITIPSGLTPGSYTLKVFSEQYNGDKKTDYASAFEDIDLHVHGWSDTWNSDDTYHWHDCTAAGCPFTDNSQKDGYGEHIFANWATNNDGTHTQTCSTCGAEKTESCTYGEDGRCTVCGYVKPTYAISASPETLDFGSEAEGYADAPAAQIVTITNTGNQSVTVNLPTSTKYIITAGTGFESGTATLASDGTATFTVQPNTGLDVGSHDDTLKISGSDGTSASVKLSFTVNAVYTLTVELNGGSGSTIGGEYTAGEVVNIDAGSRSNYRFDGWTSSNGGSFASASSASTTFTMPAADTTITANWTYSGGGGGSSDDDDEPDQPADPDDTGVSDLLNTEDHIQYLFGYPDGTFGPENNMTRAEVAQMFYNLLLDQDVEVTKTFDDVPANAWYTKAVNTLASLDIISGVGDNKFEPERSITRAEFTAMAMKFAVGGEEGENIFSDVDEDDWFYKAVVDSIQYGWIHGYGDGTFRPNNPITRAEVTAIVNNMLGRAADEDFVDEHAEKLTQFSDIEKHWAYYHIAEATNDHDYTKPSSGENWTRLN